jgi:hypothetical protein
MNEPTMIPFNHLQVERNDQVDVYKMPRPSVRGI